MPPPGVALQVPPTPGRSVGRAYLSGRSMVNIGSSRRRAVEVLASFADFSFDFLDVARLVSDAEVVCQYPMVDRDPLPSWDFGRVTLLGDAAHPMHPVGGNGSSQAVLDARVLARELARRPDVETAVTGYDTIRRTATADVPNRRAGPRRCQDLVEERAPDGFGALSDVISRQELEEIAADYERVGGFDIDRLDNRSSLSVPVPSPRRRS